MAQESRWHSKSSYLSLALMHSTEKYVVMDIGIIFLTEKMKSVTLVPSFLHFVDFQAFGLY